LRKLLIPCWIWENCLAKPGLSKLGSVETRSIEFRSVET
jgi:hypothetical protein